MVQMVQKENIDLEMVLKLLEGKMHLRELARSLEVPHSTIMRKLNILLEEGIIDYLVEGRNKVFFIKDNLQARNYVYNAERYKLIKLLNKYSKLKIILEEVLKISSCELIILFGSYSTFSAGNSSDIDIYLDSVSKEEKNKIEGLNSKINVKLGKFDKSSLLIKEIMKNHVLLKGVEKYYEKINS